MTAGSRTDSGEALLRTLLPRYLRAADAATGGALDALLSVLGAAYDDVRAGISSVYDDLFVETCAPELLPYFAAQIGLPGDLGHDPRALVGGIAALRPRKGTLDTLEAVARVVTGFPVVARDGAAAVATTWSAAYPALGVPRHRRACARVSGRPAYAGVPGTHPGGGGSFPLPGVVELSLWRLLAQPVSGRVPAPAGVPGAYTVHPLGVDAPLFRSVATGDPDWSAPEPLQRSDRATSVSVRTGGVDVAYVFGDLSEWRASAAVVVDPVLGRLLFRDPPRERIEVDALGASVGEIGGGEYARLELGALPHGVDVGASLPAALAAAAPYAGAGCAVRIGDSGTYAGLTFAVPAGGRLRVAAAPGAVPAVTGPVEVSVGAGARAELSGLLLAGPVSVHGSGTLALTDCTVRDHIDSEAAVAVARCLVGDVRAADAAVAVRDSVLCSVHAEALSLDRATVLGPTVADVLVATTSILASEVTVRRRDAGVVTYCALPRDARIPDRFACTDVPPHLFRSRRYGDPWYAAVEDNAPRAVRCGGPDGEELGAYAEVSATRRVDALAGVLAEFMPAGVGLTLKLRT
ncbi:MAG: hypothetical protein JO079_02180 [Frankiaceae bacterium]|nr:hypothetical protein [Frankiaceae bacterium]MBV9369243.1 hypothetical protein [Frankiales bacterium]